jgi:CheY-like chemotaxis protein
VQAQVPQARVSIVSSELKHLRVLIVEDEALIGLDIADAIERAGGEPVGPVPTIAEALQLLHTKDVKAAICDVNLADGDIGPVLEVLAKEGLPVVVHTGAGLPPHLESRFSHVLVFRKPTTSEELAKALEGQISEPG